MEIKKENTVTKRTLRTYSIYPDSKKRSLFSLNVSEFESHCGLALVYHLNDFIEKCLLNSRSLDDLRIMVKDTVEALLDEVESDTGHNQLMFCFTEENFEDSYELFEESEKDYSSVYLKTIEELESDVDNLETFIKNMFSLCPNVNVIMTNSSNLRSGNYTIIVITGHGE